MANDEHVTLLKQGMTAWNAWRAENHNIRPDLTLAYLSGANLSRANLSQANLSQANLSQANLKGADLHRADLSGAKLIEANLSEATPIRANLSGADLGKAYLRKADLSGANLSGANFCEAHLHESKLRDAYLSGANLNGADLREADLRGADLRGANLRGADLRGANLTGAQLNDADLSGAYLPEANFYVADLRGANLTAAYLRVAVLTGADLSGANLRGADLQGSSLVNTNFTGADLTGCRIHGVSAWGLKLDGRTTQQNLVITRSDEPEITVDYIEVAQFIYLLLNKQKIGDVIDTITSKAVLILGRFTDERKAVLDALREELRKRDYLPILFDFAVPATRDITETVSLLARMARFIIADLTDPSSIPKELEAIVPYLAVPVQPLLEGGLRPYAMFKDYWKYDWVLPPYRYESVKPLLETLAAKVITPAEEKVRALQERRRMIEAELTKPR